MDNNEKFNAMLNSCANHRQIYNALLTLAEPGFTGGRMRRFNAEKLDLRL